MGCVSKQGTRGEIVVQRNEIGSQRKQLSEGRLIGEERMIEEQGKEGARDSSGGVTSEKEYKNDR